MSANLISRSTISSIANTAVIVAASALFSVLAPRADADAQAMYRCVKAGVPSYQDQPCDGMAVVAKTAGLAPVYPVASAAGAAATTASAAPGTTGQSEETIKARLVNYWRNINAGQFDAAARYADTPEQKAQINSLIQRNAERVAIANAAAAEQDRIAAAQRNQLCSTLRTQAATAELYNQHKGGRFDRAAQAAQIRLATQCN